MLSHQFNLIVDVLSGALCPGVHQTQDVGSFLDRPISQRAGSAPPDSRGAPEPGHVGGAPTRSGGECCSCPSSWSKRTFLVLIKRAGGGIIFRSERGSPAAACPRTGLLHRQGSMWSLFTRTPGRIFSTARTTSWCNRYGRTTPQTPCFHYTPSRSIRSKLLDAADILRSTPWFYKIVPPARVSTPP